MTPLRVLQYTRFKLECSDDSSFSACQTSMSCAATGGADRLRHGPASPPSYAAAPSSAPARAAAKDFVLDQERIMHESFASPARNAAVGGTGTLSAREIFPFPTAQCAQNGDEVTLSLTNIPCLRYLRCCSQFHSAIAKHAHYRVPTTRIDYV